MKAVNSHVSLPKLEDEILEFWDKESIFEKSNERRKDAKEYSFYDGPPFANGLPHYGHMLGQTLKDIVPRYWNMRGFAVERRFGWDCHGLPVEFEVEKKLDLGGRKAILEYGVDKYNEVCRSTVLHYTEEWQKTITRLGRWVDWDNQYRTMDKSFMESVWWVLGQLNEKKLLYKDFKIVSYSPRISAVVSNFEANLNYKDVQDPAITVKFKLETEDAYCLAWTTTPWTLASNRGLVVGPEVEYVKVKTTKLDVNETYYLAKERLEFVFKDETDFTVLESGIKGSRLAGLKYEPLFKEIAHSGGAYSIVEDDYVSTDAGTGIVHCAPAFGEDDFRIGKREGFEVYDPLDAEANFTSKVEFLSGKYFKDADKVLIKRLKDANLLFKHETIVHSYAHCERTECPLIYRAIPTWYIRVESIRDDLVKNNQEIRWVPENIKNGRMGRWLENARDWAISRNRFWGTPLPIWVSDKDESYIEVISSVEELEKKSGQTFDDIHKHFVDDVTWPCPKGGTMRRVPEVFDCWFESGSMPYAQLHYPFENKDRFENVFPGDFIAEGQDQTRGWFYTLSVLSTALFNNPAFKNVVVNGIVLAEDGKKMSKRLKNYTPPGDLLEKFGADSVRLYMINSAVLRGDDLKFTDAGVQETTRSVLLPIWNALSFLTTYAEADSWKPSNELLQGNWSGSENHFDQWIVSRLQTLTSNVHSKMETYRIDHVVPELLNFIDELTNWYIRLNRRRFWSTEDSAPSDTNAAFETLFNTLSQFSKLFAPFAPFISEALFKRLHTEDSKSVHLCDVPEFQENRQNIKLEESLGLTFSIMQIGRSLRAKAKIKTRQPLSSVTIISLDSDIQSKLRKFENEIRTELNVKEIAYSKNESDFVQLVIKPNLKILGRKLGKNLKPLQIELKNINEDPKKASDVFNSIESQGSVDIAGITLLKEELIIERQGRDDQLVDSDGTISVMLNTQLSESLVKEGLAREVINRVQKARKDADLNVSDRIKLTVGVSKELSVAIQEYQDYIQSETLTKKLDLLNFEDKPSFDQFGFQCDGEIENHDMHIGIDKV